MRLVAVAGVLQPPVYFGGFVWLGLLGRGMNHPDYTQQCLPRNNAQTAISHPRPAGLCSFARSRGTQFSHPVGAFGHLRAVALPLAQRL